MLVTGLKSPDRFSASLLDTPTKYDDQSEQSDSWPTQGEDSHLTDEVVFDGTIVDGYMLGARVEDRGRLSGHSNSTMSITVKGTIQIFPAAQ